MTSKDICSICGTKSDFLIPDFNSITTAHSETPISEVLERLYAKATISLCEEFQEITKTRSACQTCLIKIDEYDLVYTNAIKIENDLLNIIKSKATKSQNAKSIIYVKIKPQSNQNIKYESEYDIEIDDSQIIPEDDAVGDDVDFDTDDDVSSYNENDKDTSESPVNQVKLIQQCTLCLKEFPDNASFNLHIKKHIENKDILKCENCNKTFQNHFYLDIHQNIHEGKSELECRYCSKTFSNRYNAAKHNRIHSKVPEYQCHLCGKQFIHRTSFQLHIQVHDDIRPFSCDLCQRLFRCKAHLDRHKLTHTGEKPFECEVCGRKFSTRYNMTQHGRLHYPKENKYHCAYCDNKFATKNDLDEHIKDDHHEMYQRTKERFFARKSRKAVYKGETVAAIDSIIQSDTENSTKEY